MELNVSLNNNSVKLFESKETQTNYVNESHSMIVIFVNDSVGPNGMMIRAAKKLIDLNINPQWMMIEQIMALPIAESHYLFVTDPFDGPIYDYLISIGSRIIGPLAIITYNEINKLPHRILSHPIHSQCMRKIKICVSGFETTKKTDLYLKIQRMSGVYSEDFTTQVTHLVTEEIGSKKYNAAYKCKIPVMTSQWINECYDKYQYQLLHANDFSIIEIFKLPIFKGLVIYVSAVNPEENERIKIIIESNGGIFSDTLNGNVKFLLMPKIMINDYIKDDLKFAMQLKIECIDVNWIYDSEKERYALPYEDYRICITKFPKISIKELNVRDKHYIKPNVTFNTRQRNITMNSIDSIYLNRSKLMKSFTLRVKNKMDISFQQYFPSEIINKSFKPMDSLFSISNDCRSFRLKKRQLQLFDRQTPYQYYRRSIADVHYYYNSISRLRWSIVSVQSHHETEMSIYNDVSEKRDLNFIAFNESKIIDALGHEYELTIKERVLMHCKPQKIIAFSDALSAGILDKCKKIGEGCYGEVFSSKDDTKKPIIIKIISIPEFDNEEEQFIRILPDLVVSHTLNHLQNGDSNQTPNFIKMIRASCVCGKFPQKLIDEWNVYADEKGTENDDPEEYNDNQLYIVMQLSNGGTDMERYVFKSAVISLNIFVQITFTLAAAECEYEFEHRDLHWGNVLIGKTSLKKLSYIIKGQRYSIICNNLIASIIDFSLSRIKTDNYIIYDDLSKYEDLFNGKGDFQFSIYRKMRENNDDDWEMFNPYSNILWLSYILDKLIRSKIYKSKAKAHRESYETLEQLENEIIHYKSASQLIDSKIFKSICGHSVDI